MKMIIRKKKKKYIILKLVMVVIIGIFCAFMLLRYFSKNISPFFMAYAEDEIKRIITMVINDSVNDEIIAGIDDEKIFDLIKNNEGEIQIVSYNARVVNELLNSVALVVQENLKMLEAGDIDSLGISDSYLRRYDSKLLKQGIICEIPFGAFSNISLISNVGPNIPVRFNLLGDVTTNFSTYIKEYGINNALLEVSIEISVNARVNLPFISNKINISNSMPISVKVIQGSIPDFYNGLLQSSFGIISSYKKT